MGKISERTYGKTALIKVMIIGFLAAGLAGTIVPGIWSLIGTLSFLAENGNETWVMEASFHLKSHGYSALPIGISYLILFKASIKLSLKQLRFRVYILSAFSVIVFSTLLAINISADAFKPRLIDGDELLSIASIVFIGFSILTLGVPILLCCLSIIDVSIKTSYNKK
jgi:hypothetical protein